MILTLCPACDRQYDVTTLDPGQTVRCVCERVFAVLARGPATIGAGVCQNCRGPVAAEHTDCPYCGVALEERFRRTTTLCPKCFARMPEGARHCTGCGIEIVPQSLQPLPEGNCPRCAGELRLRSMGEVSVVECAGCEGMWLTPAIFERVRHRAAQTLELLAGKPPESAPSLEKVRYIPCLTCGELMHRRLFRHGGAGSGVIVDLCKDHGVWLDVGELERIVHFLRKRGAEGARAVPGDYDAPPPGVERMDVSGALGHSSAAPGTMGGKVDIAGGVLEFLAELFTTSIFE